MTSFIARRPLAFSAIAVLVPIAATNLAHPALAALGVPDLANRLVAEAGFCTYVVVLLWRLRWWHDAGFTPPTTRRGLVAWLPLLLLPLIVFAGAGVKAASAERVIGFAVLTIMIGFAEEGLVRGIVLRALLPAGATRAAVLSSVFFGVGHLGNIARGASPAATVVQVVFATFLGIAFAGARMYTGTILPAIALHALIDFVDIASRGFALPPPRTMTVGRAIVPIALTGIYAFYGLWLLSRARRDSRTMRKS